VVLTMASNRTRAQRLGDAAEELAASRLRSLGWTILGRQIRVRRAEIDALALDPGPPAALVVVEVRWRASRDFGLPEETVRRAKLARLRTAGFELRAAGRLPDGTVVPPWPTLRVDLLAVEPGGRLRHHRGVG
jgi:putative endonuclease